MVGSVWVLYAIVAAILIALYMGRFVASEKVAQYVVQTWRPLVEKYTAFYPGGAPVSRVLAHIAVESAGDPAARNDEKVKGAPYDDSVGLLGITDQVVLDFNAATGRSYTLVMMEQPWANVEVGVWNLYRWRKFYKGDLDLASRQHNGNVKIQQTADYLARVKAYESIIKRFM